MPTHEDNTAMIAQVLNDILTPRVKHISVIISWINNQLGRNLMDPVGCPSALEKGDINTKNMADQHSKKSPIRQISILPTTNLQTPQIPPTRRIWYRDSPGELSSGQEKIPSEGGTSTIYRIRIPKNKVIYSPGCLDHIHRNIGNKRYSIQCYLEVGIWIDDSRGSVVMGEGGATMNHSEENFHGDTVEKWADSKMLQKSNRTHANRQKLIFFHYNIKYKST